MGKKKQTLPCSVTLGQRLRSDYERWVHIFNEGCSDPTYHDGVNIDLVRNHILYDKSEIEKTLKQNYMAYPDEYFYPDPIILPQDFMAIDRKAPILASFLRLNTDIVPKNRFGYETINQVLKFDWREVLM